MKVELDRTDLINLVKGTSPPYDKMSHPLIVRCGHFTGGFKDEWSWNYTFPDEMTDAQLWEMYQMCKQSWQ